MVILPVVATLATAEPENHIHQTGGDNCSLRRTTGEFVGELHAHVDEQFAAAAFREERANDDEVEQGSTKRSSVACRIRRIPPSSCLR